MAEATALGVAKKTGGIIPTEHSWRVVNVTKISTIYKRKEEEEKEKEKSLSINCHSFESNLTLLLLFLMFLSLVIYRCNMM